MNGESERGSGRGASIASQALAPAEAPMSTLGSGDDGWGHGTCVICGRDRSPGQGNGLGAHQSDPTPSELTTWPILPKHWATRDGFRRLWGSFRQRGNGCGANRLKRGGWPENGADPAWFRAVNAFLTRRAYGASPHNPRCEPHTAPGKSHRARVCVLVDKGDDWQDRGESHQIEA